jgi:acyl-CoA thioesterase YciA
MADPSPPREEPATRVIAMLADANDYGDVFGGRLMNMMELAPSDTASRKSAGCAVTMGTDAAGVHHCVRISDKISVYARSASLRHSFMKIAVEVWQRDRDGNTRAKVPETTFPFVAIDQDRRPRPIPRRQF